MVVSVIIVSWNAKAFLLQCIGSVMAHGPSDSLEIIVVDNASSDGSPEAVRDRFPGVRLICNDRNYGFAKANNIGIAASTGRYLFLVNSDVVVSANCFARTMAYMDAHSDIGMLGPKILGSDGQTQRSCMRYPSLANALSRALALDSLFPHSALSGGQLLTFWRHDEARGVEVINGCFWMLRRSAVDQVGLLDERFLIYGEDIDWCRRFKAHGWKVVFFPGAEALHYGGGSSANAPVKFFLEMQRANYQYWLKHHTRLASFAYLLISLLHYTVRVVGEIVAFPLSSKRRGLSKHKIIRNLAAMKWVFQTMAGAVAGKPLQAAERFL